MHALSGVRRFAGPRRREHPGFVAYAISLGLGGAVMAFVAARGAEAVIRAHQLPAVVFALLIGLAWGLPFSILPRARMSMDFLFVVAALAVLPPPVPYVAAAGAVLLGVFLRRGETPGERPTLAMAFLHAGTIFASVAVGGLMASGFGKYWRFRQPGWRNLLVVAVVFLTLNAVNLALLTLATHLRGGAAREFARLHLLYVSPLEVFTIPLILALIFLYKNSGMGAFLCLGVSLLLFSFLFRHLNRVEEGVRKVNQTLSDRTSELATLNTIGREVSASLDPARVCEVVSRSCRQVFPTGVVFIVLADPEQGGITARYVDRGERLTPEDRLPVGPGFVDWVMRTLRPLMIQDLFEDGAEMPFPAVMHDPTLRSLLLVPLVVENRAAGVMGVADPDPGKFDFQRLSVLTTIAQQTAVAIQNARHYQMATVDQMTGLYLRHHFLQRLTDERTRALRYRSPFAVIMLDLDSFKEINDRLGHNAGDQFLRMASEAIKQSLRGSDVACRWGGDEFCILLPQTDVEASRATAERIRKAIAALGASFSGAGSTASAGIATYPNDFDGNMEELVRRADQALYRAKREGRDRVAIFSRAPAEAIPVREAGGRLKGRPR